MTTHLTALPVGTRAGMWKPGDVDTEPDFWNIELVVVLLVREDEEPGDVLCFAIDTEGDALMLGMVHAHRYQDGKVMTPGFCRLVPPGDTFPSDGDRHRAEHLTEHWQKLLKGEDPDAHDAHDKPRHLRGLN